MTAEQPVRMNTSRKKNVASSASGRPARKWRSSPTTAFMRCSTGARRLRASPLPMARRCWCSRISAWSARSSMSRRWRPCRATSPIGHCRYSTTGSTTWENAQPVFRNTAAGTGVALGPQRQPGQHHRTDGPRARRGADRHPRRHRRHHRLRHPRRAAGPRRRGLHPRTGRAGTSPDGARRVLPDLHGREHALRGARPARGAAAVAGPARPRLGRGVGDRRARHRRRVVRPRHRARRASGHRRRRGAVHPLRQPDAQGLRLRVRLPRPARQHPRRAGRCTPPASRSAAGWPGRSPSTPTW